MKPVTFPAPSDAIRTRARRERIGRIIGSTKLLGALVRLRRPLDNLINLGTRWRDNERFAAVLRNDGSHDDAGYEGDKEIRAMMHYRAEVLSPRFAKLRSPSPALYSEQERVMSEILASGKIKTFINFGVSYGHIDAILAKAFPNITFHAVDRSPYTKAVNDVDFSDVLNLHFHAADIFEFLASNTFESGLLFHSRTMTLMPQSIAAKIYNAAKNSGCISVAGFEPIGLRRDTLTPYSFSDERQQSVQYRHYMFMHNYPWMLKEAGFSLSEFRAFRTNNPHLDQQMVSIVASLISD